MAMILVTGLLDVMAMGIVLPVIPALIEEFTGSLRQASLWMGIIGTLWAVVQFVCSPVIGGLSDSFGRRSVLLVSTAGMAADWVLMAIAPDLWWLIVGRIVGGATSATGAVLFAYATDVSAPQDRTRAFGLIGAAMSAGFVAGPALGGLLGDIAIRLPLWTAAAMSAAAFLFGLFVLPESLPRERRSRFRWGSASPLGALRLLGSDRQLFWLSTGFLLIGSAGRIFTSIYVLYAGQRYGMGIACTGLLLAFAGVLDLLMQGLLVGPVVRRVGELNTVLLGLAGRAAGIMAMGFAPSGWLFALALLPSSMWGLAEPPLRSLMSARVRDDAQGRMQAASHCIASLSGIVGPFLFGWIYAWSNVCVPGLAFIAAGAMVAIAAMICAAVSRQAAAEMP